LGGGQTGHARADNQYVIGTSDCPFEPMRDGRDNLLASHITTATEHRTLGHQTQKCSPLHAIYFRLSPLHRFRRNSETTRSISCTVLIIL
jgi:hypothetical protein